MTSCASFHAVQSLWRGLHLGRWPEIVAASTRCREKRLHCSQKCKVWLLHILFVIFFAHQAAHGTIAIWTERYSPLLSRRHRVVKRRLLECMVQKMNTSLQVRLLFKERLTNWLGYADQLNVVFPESRKKGPRYTTKKTKLMHNPNDDTDL